MIIENMNKRSFKKKLQGLKESHIKVEELENVISKCEKIDYGKIVNTIDIIAIALKRKVVYDMRKKVEASLILSKCVLYWEEIAVQSEIKKDIKI